jgi:hypothetical protein
MCVIVKTSGLVCKNGLLSNVAVLSLFKSGYVKVGWKHLFLSQAWCHKGLVTCQKWRILDCAIYVYHSHHTWSCTYAFVSVIDDGIRVGQASFREQCDLDLKGQN